jgi:hypothetical protein
MTRNQWKLATLTALVALSITLYAQQGPPQGPPGGVNQQPPQNLKVLPKDSTRQRVMATMNGFTRALGVKCDHCHAQGDFAKDEKPEKEVARAMLKMVMNLRQNATEFFPDERVNKVSCWTCHRGSAKIEVPAPPQQSRPPGEQKPSQQE